MAKRGSYRHGFVFGTFSFCGATVVGLLSIVITSRLYGVEIVGQFALVSAPVAALWVLSSVKEQQALIREITELEPREPRVGQLFAAVFTFSSALTALVGLLDAAACWFVFRGPLDQPGLVGPALVSIAGYVFITNTGWNVDSILAAFVAGGRLFAVNLHQGVMFVVLAAGLSFSWHSVWGLVVATIGASATALVHRLIAVRPYVRGRIGWREYRQGLALLPDLLRFGIKATPGQIAQGASQQGGVWALGLVTSVDVVGAYSRAVVIPRNLQAATMRITAVLYPTLVGRHRKGDGDGFDRVLVDSIRYEMIGMLTLAGAVGGAAVYVLEILGPGFARAAPALQLLMLSPALGAVTIAQTQALWATDRPGLTSWIAAARLLATVVLLVGLTPRIGIIGPAIALLCGELLATVLSSRALGSTLSRPLRETWRLRERAALLLAYATGFLAARGTEELLPFWPGLPLALLAGALGFAAAFVLCGGVNERDRVRIAELVRRLRSRRPPGARVDLANAAD